MKKTVEWYDWIWDPVWGCTLGCDFCSSRRYAKKMAGELTKHEMVFRKDNGFSIDGKVIDDFYNSVYNFRPTSVLHRTPPAIPRDVKRILVNQMSDIWDWGAEDTQKYLDIIKKDTEHIYFIMTSLPNVYYTKPFEKYIRGENIANLWFGVTATCNNEISTFQDHLSFLKPNKTFLSIEPANEKIDVSLLDREYVDWIIVGSETGNRRNRVVPKKDWFNDLMNQYGDILYMKDSLQILYGDSIIKRMPNEIG